MFFGHRTSAPGQKCLRASFVRGFVTAFGTAVTLYGVGLLLDAEVGCRTESRRCFRLMRSPGHGKYAEDQTDALFL